MQRFIQSNRPFLANLGRLLAFETAFFALIFGMDHTLNIPVKMDAAGSTETNVFIVMPDEYTLYLNLQGDREKLNKYSNSVMGVPGEAPPKLNIPIRWSLHIPGLKPSFQGSPDIAHGARYSAGEFGLGLAQQKIGFGWYKFKLDVTTAAPDIQAFQPRLALSAHPKIARTWQRMLFSVVFMAQIALIPALGIMLIILVWHLFAHFILKRNVEGK